jgi:hypothetical protein
MHILVIQYLLELQWIFTSWIFTVITYFNLGYSEENETTINSKKKQEPPNSGTSSNTQIQILPQGTSKFWDFVEAANIRGMTREALLFKWRREAAIRRQSIKEVEDRVTDRDKIDTGGRETG